MAKSKRVRNKVVAKKKATKSAKSIASSQNVKKSNAFEKKVEDLLKKYGLLPNVPLKSSPFKTKTVSFSAYRKKIADFWLPKFDLVVECSLSTTTKRDELPDYKESGIKNGFNFVSFIEQYSDTAIDKELAKQNIEIIYGMADIEQYIANKALENISNGKLNIGNVEYHKLDKLFSNDVNRDIDWPHVFKLVRSILTLLGKGKIQVGIIRCFTGIYINKKLKLVDAHHLLEAAKIIRDNYGYEITDVPVMVLTHLNDVPQEEVTTLMSSLNTIVLNWDNFGYVKSWKKTYELTQNLEKLYPYQQLYNDMISLTKLIDPKKGDADKAGVNLQSYCIQDQESIGSWGSNLDNMKMGNLLFDEDEYTNILEPIKKCTESFINAIHEHKECIKLSPHYSRNYLKLNKNKEIEIISMKKDILRQFCTSLKTLYFIDEEQFNLVVTNLTKEFFQTAGWLPAPKTDSDFSSLNYNDIDVFPKNKEDLKKFVEGEFGKDTNGRKYHTRGKLVETINMILKFRS